MSSRPAPLPQEVPGETVPTILPDPARIFEGRAARLRDLAPGHIVGPYLESMARLADAQVAALSGYSVKWKGSPEPTVRSLRDRSAHCSTANWRRALDVILSEMRKATLPEASQTALARLCMSEAADLESFAVRIVNMEYREEDLGASAFVGAALQVHFAVLASGIGAVEQVGPGRDCPLCGSPPVAAVVLSGRKLRYLCCSLCATRWYVPRLTCAVCNSTEAIEYFVIDGDPTGVKAEACARCRAYLKLFYLEDRPAAEPAADDLATLALDLLMSEKGYSRNGANLLLLP